MKKSRTIIDAAIVVAAIIVFFVIIKIPCPFRLLTGVSCLGCGMTRAYLSAVQFDFLKACYYHPLWPFVPISVGCYIWARIKKPKLGNLVIFISAIAMLTVYIIRWFTGPSEVVYADMTETIYYRIWEWASK